MSITSICFTFMIVMLALEDQREIAEVNKIEVNDSIIFGPFSSYQCSECSIYFPNYLPILAKSISPTSRSTHSEVFPKESSQLVITPFILLLVLFNPQVSSSTHPSVIHSRIYFYNTSSPISLQNLFVVICDLKIFAF